MEKLYGWDLPVNVCAHGDKIDQLIWIIHILMVALFMGWVSFLIIALVRFRKRKGRQATHEPGHFKLPAYLEIGIAVFEVVLLFGFAFPIQYTVQKKFPPESESLRVRVVAEQFAWNIHYHGKDRVFGKTDLNLVNSSNPVGLVKGDPAAVDDFTTINQMHIPVNKPVIVEISSKDVIHSFGVPVMRVKQDAIPGQRIPIWFEAKRTGNFEIACAQLCGLGHYRMRGFFIVNAQDEFDAWLAQEGAKKNGKS